MGALEPLPKKLYDVRIPIIATYSDIELENMTIGLDTINGKVKKDSYMELSTVMINIDRMIDVYNRGYPIYVIKQDDVDEIYRILTNYISGYHPNNQYVLNRTKVVEDRVYEIENFLEEIFGYNKHSIVKKNINANSGFNIGQGLMQYKPIEGFASPNVSTSIIQNNIPEVDISKVKRIKNTFRETYT